MKHYDNTRERDFDKAVDELKKSEARVMGKYVYLEDEEIEYMVDQLIPQRDIFMRESEKYIHFDNLIKKLSQEPKTLEELGFNAECVRLEPNAVEYVNHYDLHIIMNDKGIELFGDYTIDELQAILNRVKELDETTKV